MCSMQAYNPQNSERKWQENWKNKNLHNADLNSDKPKFYNLVMFPYPSGDKLHVGHWYNYGPTDSFGRFKKMQGYNVMQPMGFDSFGLPAENYAIKTGVPPKESIATNVGKMINQLSAMGAMWDWDKMVNTSSPEYYKWTQWIFLQLFKKGLAEKRTAPVNWCDSCKTVLANEQVENGKCERCKNDVQKKNLNQWFFKISQYSERLLSHEGLDWPEKTKLMQEHWIGKSTGINIDFKLENSDEVLTCYTTRPDTIFSVTFIVIAPEHPLLPKLIEGTEYENDVKELQNKIMAQTDIERSSEGGKDKLGAFTGKYVFNPATGEKVPVYVANFALMYGTGVVMADAHDSRDFEFAKKYNIALKYVISEDGQELLPEDTEEAYTGDGILFNSGQFSGMNNREALPKMMDWMEEQGFGEKTVNYKLRDWLISRQRYWGAPIPVVYDPDGNAHAIGEEHLPWTLPEDVDFKPDGTAPLARSKELIERTESIFGKGWKPEVDTMDTFMCSSWYYLRYPSENRDSKAFEKDLLEKWSPVDMYVGGPEHACMHLLYARFVNMALYDMGLVPSQEPFKRLVHQGMITKDGAKMSKSKGNVVSPDEFVEKYGADVFRMYLMFMGPFTDGGDWNDKGITGIARFVDKFWRLINQNSEVKDQKLLNKNLHKLIKKATEDTEKMQFNTVVAGLMEFVNFAQKNGMDDNAKNTIVRLIAPFAPHFAEECFEMLGGTNSVFEESWPEFNPELTVDDEVTLGIQVNGKVRGELTLSLDSKKEDVLAAAKEVEKVKKYLEARQIVKEIYVPGKIIGFVVK